MVAAPITAERFNFHLVGVMYFVSNVLITAVDTHFQLTRKLLISCCLQYTSEGDYIPDHRKFCAFIGTVILGFVACRKSP